MTGARRASPDEAAAPGPWRDRKRYLWLFGLLIPSLAFIALGAYAATGWAVWLWLGPLFVLGLVPVVDLAVGRDDSNPPDDVIAALEADRYYRWLTYLFLPLQYGGFLTVFWAIATWDLTTIDRIGLAVTIGFIGGIGIATAHELGHKRDSVEKWFGKIALAPAFYGHFQIEHNRGHHVRVATPEDPASARVGESFYRFWPRTVLGSLRSAWRLERTRYARREQGPWRLGNDVLNAWLLSVLLWGVVLVWQGPAMLPYLVLQAVIAFSLLELVNYLEHYGLLRERVGAPGRERYERVEPRHSWNANQIATNVLLYHLQRHSDHHANPTRRYQALRDYPDAPQLPTGYAGMILVALVPPLWSRIMDPRVRAHYDGDIGRANIQPSRRTAMLRRYPPPVDGVPPTRPVAPEPMSWSGVTPTTTDSAVLGWRCPGCGYLYVERAGAPREGFPPGTAWATVPDDWECPDCGVRQKADFAPEAIASA
ncbi:MAG: alkane 1-monooxygenase [Actinomycetales bacterium]|nr:alkane 1-monooxygenase [Actinomycetales bacterium]